VEVDRDRPHDRVGVWEGSVVPAAYHVLDPPAVVGWVEGCHVVIVAVVVEDERFSVRFSGVRPGAAEWSTANRIARRHLANAGAADDLGNGYTSTSGDWGGQPDQISGQWVFVPALAVGATTLTVTVPMVDDAPHQAAVIRLGR